MIPFYFKLVLDKIPTAERMTIYQDTINVETSDAGVLSVCYHLPSESLHTLEDLIDLLRQQYEQRKLGFA